MDRESHGTGQPRPFPARAGRPDRQQFSLRRDAYLLDVDGTILDIAPTPESVTVPESLKQTLEQLAVETAGAVALVSGRQIAALDRLFDPVQIAAIGCHGAEWRPSPAGATEQRRAPLSEEIKQTLRAVVSDQPRVRLEDKGYTMAFHYRSAPQSRNVLEERLREIVAALPGLHLLHGKSVVEVKARDFDKGEAIGALIQASPFAARRPIYLGDDKTDLDAFAMVRKLGGIGISVGRPMPGTELMLPSPRAARLWLAKIAAART